MNSSWETFEVHARYMVGKASEFSGGILDPHWSISSISSHYIFIAFFLSSFFLLIYFDHALQLAGSYFLDQGSNRCPLYWKRGVLTTGLPSLILFSSVMRTSRWFSSGHYFCNHMRNVASSRRWTENYEAILRPESRAVGCAHSLLQWLISVQQSYKACSTNLCFGRCLSFRISRV